MSSSTSSAVAAVHSIIYLGMDVHKEFTTIAVLPKERCSRRASDLAPVLLTLLVYAARLFRENVTAHSDASMEMCSWVRLSRVIWLRASASQRSTHLSESDDPAPGLIAEMQPGLTGVMPTCSGTPRSLVQGSCAG